MDEPKKDELKKDSHVKRHKKKYTVAGALTTAIVLLQFWGQLCPLLPIKLECKDTKPLAEFGKTVLAESKDAGWTW